MFCIVNDAKEPRPFFIEALGDELLEYLNSKLTVPVGYGMNPVVWWKHTGRRLYPNLAWVARFVLSGVPTSAAVERSFSAYSFVQDINRVRLSQDKARKLVIGYCNIRLNSGGERNTGTPDKTKLLQNLRGEASGSDLPAVVADAAEFCREREAALMQLSVHQHGQVGIRIPGGAEYTDDALVDDVAVQEEEDALFGVRRQRDHAHGRNVEEGTSVADDDCAPVGMPPPRKSPRLHNTVTITKTVASGRRAAAAASSSGATGSVSDGRVVSSTVTFPTLGSPVSSSSCSHPFGRWGRSLQETMALFKCDTLEEAKMYADFPADQFLEDHE
jgi:hypothetical protein